MIIRVVFNMVYVGTFTGNSDSRELGICNYVLNSLLKQFSAQLLFIKLLDNFFNTLLFFK